MFDCSARRYSILHSPAMHTAARLKIDTSITGPSTRTYALDKRNSPGTSLSVSSASKRMRSISNASSTSSLSIVSPATSSTNASSSSLQLGASAHVHAQSAPKRRAPSPIAPLYDDTVRAGPEYVLAMHDYAPQHQNATCLSFRAGQVIHVLNRDSSGWWDGELEGRRGWFPSNYVTADLNCSTEEQSPVVQVSFYLRISVQSFNMKLVACPRTYTFIIHSVNCILGEHIVA